MTARTDRAWEIATWPIAAAVWHGLNAIDALVCRWANETAGEEER